MNFARRMYLSMRAAIKEANEFKDIDHVIVPAFKSGGVQYYQFDDVFNTPYERGLEAIHAYDELTMKCDVGYLKEHQAAVAEILNGNKITMNEWNTLNRLNSQLGQRLEWVVLPDHVYRLASVVFFDASENPLKYEIGYAKKKINHWKEHDDVESFFLRKPVQELIPFLSDLELNLPSYFKAVETIDQHHWRSLYT